jgi:hypothetical protein
MSFQSPGNETKRIVIPDCHSDQAMNKSIVIPTEAGANATAQWRNLLSQQARC